MKEAISVAVNDSARAVEQLNTEESLTFIAKTAEMIAEAFNKGNKVIVAGNGGSLCDAMHFAEELTGRFRGD
ncbi:MAG: SIS domain-containing protein, partial [Waddliaceae bacterium]|nr:SIS domain-containing protein [Waddliaceae bacterium]